MPWPLDEWDGAVNVIPAIRCQWYAKCRVLPYESPVSFVSSDKPLPLSCILGLAGALSEALVTMELCRGDINVLYN